MFHRIGVARNGLIPGMNRLFFLPAGIAPQPAPSELPEVHTDDRESAALAKEQAAV